MEWTPPTIPSGGQQIAGYYVYAADSDVLPYEFLHTLPVATVPADAVSLDLTDLATRPFDPYKLSIKSFDSLGKSSVAAFANVASPGPEVASPGPPRSVRTIIWTLNDALHPRSRSGIKIAWQPARNQWGWVRQGYRVYRRPDQSSAWCAMLQGSQSVPLPPGVGLCSDPTHILPSGDYTAPEDALSFFDSAPTAGQIYYYRITELRLDNGSPPQIRETPFDAAQEVGGRVLPFRQNVLPPPQTFKAWAPEPSVSPGDAKDIALRWCPIPTDAAGGTPSVAEYWIYRKHSAQNEPFSLLAKIDPACLNQSNGQPSTRCVITSGNQCQTGSCTTIHPDAAGCSGQTCMVLDSTFINWPDVNLEAANQHAIGDYTYYVTAVGYDENHSVDPTTESLQSVQNEGWLNYCIANPCIWRREPEGDSEFLWRRQNPDHPGGPMVCGDQDVRLSLPEDIGGDDMALDAPAGDGQEAPYRVIGQAADIPSRFLFYHLDHLGSPRLILDSNGDVETKHHYLPFGEEWEEMTDATQNSRGFTGHESDPESNLNYMMARYYSPSLGRFMAVDPGNDTDLENPQSWNKYSYVKNSPLDNIDPNGQASYECARPIRLWIAQKVGAVHMFTVSGAPALGVSSSETELFSFGKTDSGKMGMVTENTSNSTSNGVAQADALAWQSAALPGSSTVCSEIPASDDAVSTSASSVMETSGYSAMFPALGFGLNSNSAAQAIAEDAAQACVEPPAGWAPGAHQSDEVEFDKNGDGKADPK